MELSKLRNMKMSTFSSALSCLGDTCKQGQKQAEEKTEGRKVSSLQKRSQSDTMRKQRMGGKTGKTCRRFSKDFPALLLCSLHKRDPLLAKAGKINKLGEGSKIAFRNGKICLHLDKCPFSMAQVSNSMA